jgi:dTDP-glucose 4,6-dehydratase
MHSPRNLLVTGGAGFIGSNFVHWLLAHDQQVRIVNLDALTYAGSMQNLDALPDPSRHIFYQGDIVDGERVAEIVREHRIDTVAHFAAESHVDRSIEGPAVFVRTNVMGTYSLLEACRGYWIDDPAVDATKCRFHHVSTDEVYGSLGPNDPAFTEETRYAPNSPYSASKAGSDHLVRAYAHTYGLPVTISNCSNNYGPRQHAEKFIPTVIRSCLSGEPIPVYGDGGNVRDWLYVDDHCEGIDAVIRRGTLGEVYNIGGDCEIANIDLVRRICSLMDEAHPAGKPHARLISFVKDRPGHDWRYAIDSGKITRELGWRAKTGLEEGLGRTVGSLAQHKCFPTT